jgi:hypothetical protein
MPGHIIMLVCECGITTTVQPGALLEKTGFVAKVIVYDAEEKQFMTMRNDEAEDLGLKLFEDPYISNPAKFIYELEEEVGSRGYECPNCNEMTLQYGFLGHWD